MSDFTFAYDRICLQRNADYVAIGQLEPCYLNLTELIAPVRVAVNTSPLGDPATFVQGEIFNMLTKKGYRGATMILDFVFTVNGNPFPGGVEDLGHFWIAVKRTTDDTEYLVEPVEGIQTHDDPEEYFPAHSVYFNIPPEMMDWEGTAVFEVVWKHTMMSTPIHWTLVQGTFEIAPSVIVDD